MRYRRLTYRYTRLGGDLMPPGDLLRDALFGAMVRPTWWRPHADLFETADTVTLTVELAGVDPEALEVLLYEDALVITGQRAAAGNPSEGVYHAAEIQRGPFRLEVRIPVPVDANRVEARYDAGLLQVTIPKAAGGR